MPGTPSSFASSLLRACQHFSCLHLSQIIANPAIFPIFPLVKKYRKFSYKIQETFAKGEDVMRYTISNRKTERVPAWGQMPRRLAEAWLAASALEGISRSEFLRKSLEERTARILSSYSARADD